MEIRVDAIGTDDAISLAEPDDFKGFKIVVASKALSDLAPALSRIGTYDGSDHAYVSVAALKELAGERAQDPAWLSSLADMLGYAGSKGWLNADGDIQAHIERS
jgi:hypothetical protein